MSSSRPPHPCASPGCPELVTVGARCEAHTRTTYRQDRQRRGSARERGYGTRWDKYSVWFRQQTHCPTCGRNHVLCERCQLVGKVEVSEMVDHIIPISGPQDPLFWQHSNHAGLSNACHRVKTKEDIAKGLTR